MSTCFCYFAGRLCYFARRLCHQIFVGHHRGGFHHRRRISYRYQSDQHPVGPQSRHGRDRIRFDRRNEHVIFSFAKHLLYVTLLKNASVFFLPQDYIQIFSHIAKTNFATLIISVISMVVIYCVKHFINERYKAKLIVPVPIDLIVVNALFASRLTVLCLVYDSFLFAIFVLLLNKCLRLSLERSFPIFWISSQDGMWQQWGTFRLGKYFTFHVFCLLQLLFNTVDDFFFFQHASTSTAASTHFLTHFWQFDKHRHRVVRVCSPYPFSHLSSNQLLT